MDLIKYMYYDMYWRELGSLYCNVYSFVFSECKDIDTSEELVLNTVACINNLSYFNCKNSAVTTQQIRVLECKYSVACRGLVKGFFFLKKHMLWVLIRSEVLLMSSHNIYFYGETLKIVPELSSNTPP